MQQALLLHGSWRCSCKITKYRVHYNWQHLCQVHCNDIASHSFCEMLLLLHKFAGSYGTLLNVIVMFAPCCWPFLSTSRRPLPFLEIFRQSSKPPSCSLPPFSATSMFLWLRSFYQYVLFNSDHVRGRCVCEFVFKYALNMSEYATLPAHGDVRLGYISYDVTGNDSVFLFLCISQQWVIFRIVRIEPGGNVVLSSCWNLAVSRPSPICQPFCLPCHHYLINIFCKEVCQ